MFAAVLRDIKSEEISKDSQQFQGYPIPTKNRRYPNELRSCDQRWRRKSVKL